MSNAIQPRIDGRTDIAIAEEALAAARLIKKGTAQDGLVYADAGDTPIGVTLSAAAEGEEVEYSELGAGNWVQLTAADVIGAGAEYKVANDGKIAAKVSAAEDSIGVLHPRQVATAANDLVIGRLYDRPIRYPAAVDAETLHALDVEAPEAGDDQAVLSYEHATPEYKWVEALTATAPASQAQGDIFYRNATVFARLAAGTKGQVLQTGGSAANPAWGDVLQCVRLEPQSDVGAGATVNYDIFKVPTGFKLTPVELRLQCGTVADATFSLQANDTDIDTPEAAADDAAIDTFTDTIDAGEVARLEIVTTAGTGDVDAPQFTLFYYMRPV